jgi:hypothetical protein
MEAAGSKIEGLLPLFWGPALHIPFKIFCNPSKYFATLQKGRGIFL